MTQFRRSFDWIPTAMDARSARPTPQDYFPALSPTFDSFGTSRLPEVQFEEVLGANGSIEIVHSVVPNNRWRYYLSVQYLHTDGVAQTLSPARIIRTATGFPIARFRDEESVAGNTALAVRQVAVGPSNRLAIEARAMGGAARLEARFVWIELPIGETLFSSL